MAGITVQQITELTRHTPERIQKFFNKPELKELLLYFLQAKIEHGSLVQEQVSDSIKLSLEGSIKIMEQEEEVKQSIITKISSSLKIIGSNLKIAIDTLLMDLEKLAKENNPEAEENEANIKLYGTDVLGLYTLVKKRANAIGVTTLDFVMRMKNVYSQAEKTDDEIMAELHSNMSVDKRVTIATIKTFWKNKVMLLAIIENALLNVKKMLDETAEKTDGTNRLLLLLSQNEKICHLLKNEPELIRARKPFVEEYPLI